MTETYGSRIRRLREKYGISQEEVAEAAGYTNRSTIAKIEKGAMEIPLSKVEAIAAVLHTTPAELLGFGDPVAKQNPDSRLGALLAYLAELNLNCIPNQEARINYQPFDAPAPDYQFYDAEQGRGYVLSMAEMGKRAELIASVASVIIKTRDEDLLYLYKYVDALDDRRHEVELVRRLLEGIFAKRPLK